jgi:hypothetical protein
VFLLRSVVSHESVDQLTVQLTWKSADLWHDEWVPEFRSTWGFPDNFSSYTIGFQALAGSGPDGVI